MVSCEIQGKRETDKPHLMGFAESGGAPHQDACLPYDLASGSQTTRKIYQTDSVRTAESTAFIRKTVESISPADSEKSITMLHGLNKLAVIEKQTSTSKAA